VIAPATGPKRILVIEDNPDLAYGLRNNLEIEGYEVEVAKDGTRGLSRARTANPDLVVLDLMLPGWTASACSARCAKTATACRC